MGSGARTRAVGFHPELLAALGAAVLLRVPTILSRAPLTYDDGVYLASAGALRAGGHPFREVFSSQGPAFLPLLWAADAVGLRTRWSPRLLPLLAIVALVVVVYALARRVADRWGAGLAVLVAASSGVLLFSTSRVGSDGLTAAFAAGAVLVASGAPSRRRDVGASILVGLAVAVKSLFAGPAALAVLFLILRRGGWRRALAVAGGSLALLVVLALPWDPRDVWEQSVALHLRAREGIDLGANVELVRDELHDRDRVLQWLVVAAAATAIARWAVTRQRRAPGPDSDLAVALWIWMAAALLLTCLHAPLQLQHLTMLIPPAAVLLARYRPPLVVVAAVLLFTVPGQAERAEWGRAADPPSRSEAAAIELVRGIVPGDGLVISDEHALVWLAGRETPGTMVDLSFARIRAGDVTTADVVAAASEREVCAVVLWTGRLASLPGLRRALVDYRSVQRDGAREVLLREGCAVRP